ncbi:hypothetical protein ABEB36_015305 [Hypothenemus hampei]|uniref:MADF domain-containing protein n=1 Tax=Hypothenemus hampei TaxID=57062 RepID=A0ABD1E018_HYPHA
MSRWSENMTIKFVQEYRARPCLWNTKLAIYKNKAARDTALKEIEEVMGVEGFGINEIKNKIKNLRSTYSQEKRKIKDSKKSGAGIDDVYVPNIKWSSEMDSFLKNFEDKKRPTEDNFNITEQFEDNNDFQQCITTTKETVEEILSKKPKTPSKLQQVSTMVQDLKKISEKVTMEPCNENEFIIFGRSVVAQLNSLTPLSAIKAQERIQSVLTSFKIKDLQKSDYHRRYIITTPSIPETDTPSTSSLSTFQSPEYTAMESPTDNANCHIIEYEYC